MSLSAQQHLMMQGILRALPEKALRSLDMALSLTREDGLKAVAGLVSSEIQTRMLRDAVFAPYMPLFDTGKRAGETFPRWLLERVWAGLEADQADMVAEARYMVRGLRTSDPTPVPFFHLINSAAELCEQSPETVLDGRNTADEVRAVESFAGYLRLHRVLRRFLPQINDFLGKLDADKTTTLRLMFKDASGVDTRGGHRFMEVVFAHLVSPLDTIRMLAAVSEKASDRFLAGSELGVFGERILDSVETRITALKALFPRHGKVCDDMDRASAEIAAVLQEVQAFEKGIELSREGPWGKRIAVAHREIAEIIEGQLKAAENLLPDVLPMHSQKVYGRMRRDVPATESPPDAVRLARAIAVVRFVATSRNVASAGGFAAQQSRVSQALEADMDSYFEALLDIANGDEPFDPEALLPWFEAASDLMEALCGEAKGHIARRRIASSNLFNPPKSEARAG